MYREQSLDQPLTISLRNKEGDIYTKREIFLSREWKKYELEFIAPSTNYSGRLALTVSGRGKVYLDFVSLFPKDTYKGRRNGLRKDIAEKLADLKPKFMRFPGGCLVHDGSLDKDVRDSQYRWKNTIGPLEERPARKNNWAYNQTLGLGYYEYFQFCEDIGAKPVPILPAGWDPHHHRAAPLDSLQPWIDDALDLIEFANDDLLTEWGSKRAELGHNEPFGLEYIGIGNEEVGAEFSERYELIHNAVREKYPQIKIINSAGPHVAGSEYERGWKSARENHSDIIDEHYYMAPEWFLANHHRYDNFSNKDPKVFLGEYASWGNTFYNVLIEASYMIGLERNAHIIALACYAPLLCNVDYINWKPDLIWFNNHQVYGTANYYVQKLFMNHQGDQLLDVHIEDDPEAVIITKNPERISGNIVLSANESTVTYYDITLTNDNTKEVCSFPECNMQIGEFTDLGMVEFKNYTLKMKAKELNGVKGFKIIFGKKDDKNKLYWEIGGWQNQDTYISEDIEGGNTCHSQCLLSVERDRDYELEIKITGRHVQTTVDGILFHDIECKPVVLEPLYYSASKEDITGDIIIKIVNVSDINRKAIIEILNTKPLTGCAFCLEGYALDAMNDFQEPEYIHPTMKEIEIDNNLEYEFAKHSLVIFRLRERISCHNQ
ncbi:alpha-L-arabinofuranosidase C-terminal domain-containing protein [Anaerocolumna jejuensis]|uniref:alpha-L-arabinofuranosidase C-terminal domain-containing protein n=1 Tax=Anaerocolumna jejuensis TaxID=259063 RepID=UPI003F7C8F58